eukprot:1139819-Amorphochlora_amoeboformis.AAC.1
MQNNKVDCIKPRRHPRSAPTPESTLPSLSVSRILPPGPPSSASLDPWIAVYAADISKRPYSLRPDS